tara:strand:+ start:154 stop:378 length:225 start_codon:yes stop_codon:yes gene_type:complete
MNREAIKIEEMREQLVNNEIDYISQMVIQDRHQELFDYVMKTCGFKDDEDTEIESIYMDLYGDDMLDEQEVSNE